MTDSCHSPSVTDGLTFLGSTEAHTSRSPLLLPSFGGAGIYKHPKRDVDPHCACPQEFTFLSTFSLCFFSWHFLLSLFPSCPWKWHLMMMSENEGYSVGRENPWYASYSLSLFPRASKYKIEEQEDRLWVVRDHVIEEKKKNRATKGVWPWNDCCYDIQQRAGEVTLDPVRRKTMSGPLAIILYFLWEAFEFFSSSSFCFTQEIMACVSFCLLPELVRRKPNSREALASEN